MYLLLLLIWVLSPNACAFHDARQASRPVSSIMDPGEPANEDMAVSARRAAEVLAQRQQPAGYWLTAYTDATRFEKPREELNTFTNAVVIDIVQPVARPAGITRLVERTRAFLAKQIEADGLVRYHGRPDAPTIGRLGCIITPDADDTALVWRIAPDADRGRLSMALAKLRQFRTSDGLYRTWLASQDRYQCLDPGSDPNPADIGIQMHVLMLLAQVDPASGGALCRALTKASLDDKLWVYYRAAPLVPLLRLADLEKAHCPLHLPSSRSQTAVEGQGAWVDVVRLVTRMDPGQATSAEYSEAARLLRELAANDFSAVKANPPLLYHNDFTAHVSRFYWSEDVGYALWLRLYFESAHASPRSYKTAPM